MLSSRGGPNTENVVLSYVDARRYRRFVLVQMFACLTGAVQMVYFIMYSAHRPI